MNLWKTGRVSSYRNFATYLVTVVKRNGVSCKSSIRFQVRVSSLRVILNIGASHDICWGDPSRNTF